MAFHLCPGYNEGLMEIMLYNVVNHHSESFTKKRREKRLKYVEILDCSDFLKLTLISLINTTDTYVGSCIFSSM